jgi:hypothetical protein
MSDGVDLSRRVAHGHMPREQAAAHRRLASLPTTRHVRGERDASEIARARAEVAERIRRTRLDREEAREFAVVAPRERGASQPRMSGRTQRELILEALRDGPMTAAEICERFQATRATARIADLRDAGHDIATDRVETAAGVVYRYRLIREAKR